MANERDILLSWNGYQKLYIGNSWYSDNLEAGVFIAEHEFYHTEDLSHRWRFTCIITLEDLL